MCERKAHVPQRDHSTAIAFTMRASSETSLRNEVLSFDHHRFVAPFSSAQQRKWLARAIEEGWSSAQPKASNRGIAKALRVDEKTVRNDAAASAFSCNPSAGNA